MRIFVLVNVFAHQVMVDGQDFGTARYRCD